MRMITVLLLIILAGCLNTTPPSWKTCSPREDSTHLSDLDTLIFACNCSDADGDSLTYTWLINGEIVSTENTFTFTGEAGTYTVEVVVSDGDHQISRLWNVWVIESIDIEPLIQFIEEFRNLEFEEEPEWKYFTRQEHTQYFSDQLEYIRKETEESGKFFTAIHVWNPEKDFFQECIKSSVGIGGMYSYKDKVFYEVIDPNMPLVYRRVVVLEELSHTLANQYFDIDAATEDQWLAINVLIEGEGEFVKREYIKTLPTEEFLIIQNYKPETAVEDIDPLLLAMLVYPYGFGELFVGYLLDKGGWELVNEAYRNPPDSTEQVIHPEKFLMREKPIPMSIPDIPGWNVLERDVLGEGFYSIILRTYLPMDEVDRAVSGWGGDAYCLFERWDGSIMVLNTAWDTTRDAEEFLNSYLHFTQEWSNGYTVLEEDPGRMLLLAQNTFVLIVYSDIYVLVIESESEENVRMAESIMEEQE
ncbi:MAG: hypothetical protein HXS44_06980 [Theionarchaea archaeon]|nr:hypothetical protein [Theionarchaea archaeon]